MGGFRLIILCGSVPIKLMYYVYALLSLNDRKFYIGFTRDLKRRLKEHNLGKNISTKSRLPLKLLYYEAHVSKTDAMRRKRYFKNHKR